MHAKLASLRRLALFALVGLTNTALIYALFVALLYLGMGYNLAVVVDYAVGMILGYALQRRSTFRDRQPSPGAFAKYVTTNLLAFGIDLGTLNVLVVLVGSHPAVARVASISVMALVSFALQLAWVFRQGPTQGLEGAGDQKSSLPPPHAPPRQHAHQVIDK